MNKPLALETEHFSPEGCCWVNMEGGYLTGDVQVRVSYQGMYRRRLWKWVSLSVSVGALLGNLGGGFHLLGTLIVEEGHQK
jgi:hypothetical protein